MNVLPYKRSDRVSSEIYQVIMNLMYNSLSDPRLDGVKITGVDMTDDLQLLKIYFFVDADDEKREEALQGLESAKGFIKRAIGQQVKLRIMPELSFYYDEQVQNAERIDFLLEKLRSKGQMGEGET